MLHDERYATLRRHGDDVTLRLHVAWLMAAAAINFA